MAKTGRPSSYTPEIGAKICARMTTGDSLRKICKDEKMPGISSIMRWLFDPVPDDDPRLGFRVLYARARQAQAELRAEEIVNIADNGDEDVQRSRLRVDARKWVASKLLPRVYGDKTILEGGDADKPIQIALDDTELARHVALILSRTDPGKGKA